MCGIAGYIGPLDASSIDFGDFLAHRGPDDFGEFVHPNGRFKLHHRRLSIIDLSQSGSQPMSSFDGRITLVYNGELFNFIDLKKQLSGRGYRFRGSSDTEVVMNLIHERGRDALKFFDGMFSLAYWDEADQSLNVSRDKFGVKPLYYSFGKSGFFFASEIKAIVAASSEIYDTNYQSVINHLHYLYNPGTETPLNGVNRLAPGETMSIDVNGAKRSSFVSGLPQKTPNSSLVTKSISDVVAHTRNKLSDAVRSQLVSDVPVGCFLSGGVDSSAILGYAKREKGDIQSFTILPKVGGSQKGSEDLNYAIKVASKFDSKLNIVEIDPTNIVETLPKIIWHLEEPIADPASFNSYFIAEAARSIGVKVLLSGTGGDDLFSGYGRHLQIRLLEGLNKLPRRVLQILIRLSKHFVSSFPEASKLRRGDTLLGFLLDADYSRFYQQISEHTAKDILSRDFSESASVEFNAYLEDVSDEISELEKLLCLEQRFFLSDNNLLYIDKMTMAHGVEARVPFLSNELAEYVAGVSPKIKQKWLQNKWLLKAATSEILPTEVLKRRKVGFSGPLAEWLRDEWYEFAQDTLASRRIQYRGMFNIEKLRSMLIAHRNREVDASKLIASVLMIEIWHQVFIDNVKTKRFASGR